MSDLISRSALLDKHSEYCGEKDCDSCRFIGKERCATYSAIMEIPLVEAVPVIHCKDCTQWGCGLPMETDSIKCCGVGGYMVGKEGYCVYGQNEHS